MLPGEHQIERVIRDTGMGRCQAINHLRQRAELQRRARWNRPNWYEGAVVRRAVA